jgi:abortive infection bacteriophage resistance protein
VDGASLELVVALAEFDKGLRLLALYALETIEVAVRVTVAHHLGRFDPQAHLNPKLFCAQRGGAPCAAVEPHHA